MALRVLGWVALGIALGFALGGIPARREKAQLAEENRELREQLRAGSGPNLFRMLLGDPMGDLEGDDALEERYAPLPDESIADGSRRTSHEADAPLPARDTAAGQVSVVGDELRAGTTGARARTGSAAAAAPDEQPPPRTPEERRARRERAMRNLTQSRFKRFASAQAARAAATRSALISSGNLSEQQVAQLDTTIESTNRKLQGYGEEVLTNVAAGKEPEPAQALSLARDVADILHEGQTEVDRIVAESGAEVPPESTQIWNLIDPEGLSETAERVLPEEPPEGAGGGLRLPRPPGGLGDAGLPTPGSSP